MDENNVGFEEMTEAAEVSMSDLEAYEYEPETKKGGSGLLKGVGISVVLIGAAYGIGKLVRKFRKTPSDEIEGDYREVEEDEDDSDEDKVVDGETTVVDSKDETPEEK